MVDVLMDGWMGGWVGESIARAKEVPRASGSRSPIARFPELELASPPPLPRAQANKQAGRQASKQAGKQANRQASKKATSVSRGVGSVARTRRRTRWCGSVSRTHVVELPGYVGWLPVHRFWTKNVFHTAQHTKTKIEENARERNTIGTPTQTQRTKPSQRTFSKMKKRTSKRHPSYDRRGAAK